MDMRSPPLEIKIMLESNPPKSIIWALPEAGRSLVLVLVIVILLYY